MKTIMFWLTVIILIALDLSILEVMYRSNILDIVIFVILNAVAFVIIRHAKEELFNDKSEV